MVIDVTHTEAIDKIIKGKKLFRRDVAKMLNLNSPGSVIARMQRKGVWIHKLVELLDVLGYEMVVRRKSTEEPPEDTFVMDPTGYAGYYNEGEATCTTKRS